MFKINAIFIMRFIDIILSLIGLIILFPFFILIYLAGLMDTGQPIFIQTRVGKNKIPFKLIKFRTMKLNTRQVPTHLASNDNITKLGRILRRSKLDELPQLINVLKGDMSFVGPRPNLINQTELIRHRENLNVYKVIPGITGLAQIKNIDMSDPQLLAKVDSEMINSLTISLYIQYIVKTILGAGFGDRVRNS